ncbi:glycoside hydrolase family 36 protein [Microbacterium sp. ZW T5_45]|uniref:glycoside hydrolase family 36 protein n=1 Tax=Microbacterium sp. ZW T5_45 TaxID=3378080 RepID=UPI0038555D7F
MLDRAHLSALPLAVSWTDDRPVSLDEVGGLPFGRTGVPLVQVTTSAEQRGRTSQAYVRSAVGDRLRYVSHDVTEQPEVTTMTVLQRDAVTLLEVRTTVEVPAGQSVVRVTSAVSNPSASPVVITSVGSLTVGLGRSEEDLNTMTIGYAESEWVAENRWREMPLREVLPDLGLTIHAQDGRGHFAVTSHGSWSTGEHLPLGVITDTRRGLGIAWQIESSGPWLWDLTQTLGGGVLSLLGPTDLEHQFAHTIRPGETFTTVPAAIAISPEGRDGAFGELTHYRRWLRRESQSEPLPLVYNDFMNTLMGQPTTDALLPLIDAAADAGAEVFCIDAGWFANPEIGDWWTTVGEWRVAEERFAAGFRQVTNHIHARGMRLGIWLEPEVIGVDSAVAASLPSEAFFTRFGTRVVEDRRFHLDLRHPAARAHLDATVDHLVAEYGVSYFKLDYNINPGAGTELHATTAGDGLLAHTRALQEWIRNLTSRHPDVLIENCSSGAMRADYGLLSVTHLQSTSDQQNFELYPPIAASAPASILPEQCGNWAYPATHMSWEDTVFTLVTGLSGRLYLSGFLHELRADQEGLVREAVAVHKGMRDDLRTAVPFWPLGLPAWDDLIVCLGLRSPQATYLFIWDRAEESRSVDIPDVTSTLRQTFPRQGGTADSWSVTSSPSGGTHLRTSPGRSARMFVADRD